MNAVVACTREEKQLALDRAVASRTFSRSEQLRAFLRFVCEAELNGVSGAINEYVVGVEVLGRPPGYSPAEDSTVRTRAYELRQKLEKLYATELREESLEILIPKGAYVPQFVRPEAPAGPLVASPAPVVLAPADSLAAPLVTGGRPRRFLPLALACLVAAAALGAAITYLVMRHSSPWARPDAILREAWEPIVRSGSSVLLCTATPLSLVLGPEGHSAYGSVSYPAPPELYAMFRHNRPLAPNARLGLISGDNLLGVGTMNAVVSSAKTLQSLGAASQVLPERVAALSLLHDRSALLFGAPVDSAAITRIMEPAPLTVSYDPAVREFVVKDRTSGRTFIPKKNAEGDFLDVYGLITVLNNRDSDRGRLGMVVFSGVTSAGTQGAAEFFSSADSLRTLRTVFSKSGINDFPPAYQVVVRCTFSDSLLLSYDYETHRILQR